MPNYHLGPTTPICYPLGVTPVAQKTDFLVYPNPSTGLLQINYAEAGVLEISDITNRQVKTVNLQNTNGGKKTVDLSELPSGIFVCRYMVSGVLRAARKIIIAHE
jgi:hypothetical protein